MPLASRAISRDSVKTFIMYVLSKRGTTISVIEEKKNRKYDGDASQKKYQDKHVWITRNDLIESVAKLLKINKNLWGPNRNSNKFHNIVDQEIGKLRRKKEIVDWSSTKQLGIFRLEENTSGLDELPNMTLEDPSPQKNNHDPYTDTSEQNLKKIFISIISESSKSNTYKFTLAKSLLDYCKETDENKPTYEIPYTYFASKFLKYYWYQEYKFRMKQDYLSKGKPNVIQQINSVFGDNPPGDFSLLEKNDIDAAEQKILKAVFGSIRSKKSIVIPAFQNISVGQGAEERKVFYDYDNKSKKLYLRKEAFDFFKKNNSILSKAVLAEWAKFLEKINHSLPRLVAKIDQYDLKRGSLNTVRNMYLKHTDHCFYCASKLEDDYIEVDHFIPWSYIFDDAVWNLVLSCKDCNRKKSNSLAEEEFHQALIKRNSRHYEKIRELQISLDQLNTGKGWKPVIKNHYVTCKDYGFAMIRMP